MSENRYQQGMARPEIDIGARGGGAQAGRRADDARHGRRRVHRRQPRAGAPRHGTEGRRARRARLHPGGALHDRGRRGRRAARARLDRRPGAGARRVPRPPPRRGGARGDDPRPRVPGDEPVDRVPGQRRRRDQPRRGDDRVRRSPHRQLLVDRRAPAGRCTGRSTPTTRSCSRTRGRAPTSTDRRRSPRRRCSSPTTRHSGSTSARSGPRRCTGSA